MRGFSTIGAILSGTTSNINISSNINININNNTTNNNSSPPSSPTSSTSSSVPPTPTTLGITRTRSISSPSPPTSSTSTSSTLLAPPKTTTRARSASSRISINIAGLMADTVHHEVRLVRYTEYLAQCHSDDADCYDDAADDSKSEKAVQRFFDRDWDQHDWDADAEEWEEPDWSQRIREERRLTNMRKECRI